MGMCILVQATVGTRSIGFFEAVVTDVCLTRVLGTKLRSSAKVVLALNHWGISAIQWVFLILKFEKENNGVVGCPGKLLMKKGKMDIQ